MEGAAGSLVKSSNTYLRVGQFSCLGFVSLIFLILSFHSSITLCIKTQMALKILYFSKFPREHAAGPPMGSQFWADSYPVPKNF